jgi:hydrogenase/urease accessory protein HupE
MVDEILNLLLVACNRKDLEYIIGFAFANYCILIPGFTRGKNVKKNIELKMMMTIIRLYGNLIVHLKIIKMNLIC